MMGGRGTASGLTGSVLATPAPAAQPQPAPQPQQAQTTGRTATDMGIAKMDDATLYAAIHRGIGMGIKRDGRQDTLAQHIADALGFTANKPDSVSQEALAQYRGKHNEDGTIYRTVAPIPGKTARQIAHDLTSSDDFGLNFGGGRAYGTGLYFAGNGRNAVGNAAARDSHWYGRGHTDAYMMEARIKSTARIAKSDFLNTSETQAWAKTHTRSLTRLGFKVMPSGVIRPGTFGGSNADMKTTIAMLMGYDGYSNGDARTPYYTIWNRGALQVARGNKYARAGSGQL